MSRALDMFIVEGIHTSIPLHRRIMKDPEFIAGRIDTKFMERFLAEASTSQHPPAVSEMRTETTPASVQASREQVAGSPRKSQPEKRVKENS
jgi:acetyl/propionyl-CoA carboxylase alpha subunit